MNTLKFWKKLNAIVKTGSPLEAARKMIDTEEITKDEIAWAIAALATLPLAMLETLEPNTHTEA